MQTILEQIWAGFIGASELEKSATILGVLGVWLMIRRSLWAFPVGMAQVTLSAIVFRDYHMYADAALQFVFFAALAYGWWHWLYGGGGKAAARAEEGARAEGGEKNTLPVTRLPSSQWSAWAAAGAVGAWTWGWFLDARTDADMPYWDATIASFSLVGQWLQARKKLENWAVWIAVDVLAVGVFWVKELYWFSFLYGLFVFMAIGGHREWLKAFREHARR